jgi:hypothetical protein
LPSGAAGVAVITNSDLDDLLARIDEVRERDLQAIRLQR